jgi:hypothetical protein
MNTAFVIRTVDKSLQRPLRMTAPQLALSRMEASHG